MIGCTKCGEIKDATQFPKRQTRCKKCISEYNAEYHQKNLSKRRDYKLKVKYGISHDEYLEMLEKQNGLCAICHSSANDEHHGLLVVDHCHVTGNVRELLCRNCNLSLGNAKESIEILHSMIAYLNRHSEE